jgi:hypothetical protein
MDKSATATKRILFSMREKQLSGAEAHPQNMSKTYI